VVAPFQEGFCCSQAVFTTLFVEIGVERDTALKISQAFCGGMVI
jgi:hypothetical protein